MKELIERYVFGLFLLTVCMGFVSCSKDDNEEDINGSVIVNEDGDGNKDEESNDFGNGDLEDQESEMDGVRMERPIVSFSDGHMCHNYAYNAMGWLKGFTVYDEYEGFTYSCDFSYTLSTITTTYSDGDVVCYNIRKNKKGYIASFDYRCEWRDEEGNKGSDDGGGYVSYEYDDEGHLVAERGRQDYEGEPAGNWIVKYTWLGGNLTKVDINMKCDNGDSHQKVVEYMYDTNKYSNSGIFFHEDVFEGSWLLDFPGYYYSGLFGIPTKNIPIEFVRHYEEYPAYIYKVMFVGYNEDGTINKISFDDGEKKTFLEYGYAKYPLLLDVQFINPTKVKRTSRGMKNFGNRRVR